ncbi:MAG: phosphoglycerate mutase family protein [Balneolaceae bacterium]
MRKTILVTLLLTFTIWPLAAQEPDTISQETTLIFVRHAEKLDDGTYNPSLSKPGKERAVRLANLLLKDYHIAAIYSTSYNRALETAQPLADSLEIQVLTYDMSDPNTLIEKLITEFRGQEVLIVGHSNTTPLLVNTTLGVGMYEQLDEKAYGYIFIVQASGLGKAGAEQISY